MKAALVILSVLVAALSLYGFVQHLNAQGAVNVLDAIQSVHHGATKAQVRAVMQREPNVIPGAKRPSGFGQARQRRRKASTGTSIWEFHPET